MNEQYTGALLYLVPVVVAAIVAFIVTRPEKEEPVLEKAPAARPVVPLQRTYQPVNRRATPSTPPTLLHAALSSHLAAVSASAGPAVAKLPVVRPSRLVSIRRPARIPRRAIHQCPHKA